MHQTIHQSNATSWQRVQTALKQIWGYDSFRPPQDEIIRGLLKGTDTLVVMPTGGGKSICFQLPALLQQGLTIVVSPLVALMENQVRELQQRRLPAALLHNQLDKRERSRLLWQIDQQQLRLLYASPETLLSPLLWQRLNQPHILINGLILDEAHCLVQWGDTFRPDYRRLGTVRTALLKTQPNQEPMAIAAFTATADPQAQTTIESVLNLKHPRRVLLNPQRKNLTLQVQTVWTPRGRRSRLHQWLQSYPKQSGLIYVRTRRQTEDVSDWLNQKGHKTATYHAGLGAAKRRQVEAAWLGDEIPVVVCTSAFGMGIDKPNCRWVLQMQAPTLLSEYVQEVGRAGRDGDEAIALTFISEPTGWLDDQDQRQRQFIHDQQRKSWQQAQQLIARLPQNGDIQTVSRQFKQGVVALSLLHADGQLTWLDPFHYTIHSNPRLKPPFNPAIKTMQQFLHTRNCRWQFILSAFGFDAAGRALGQKGCGRCDRCLSRQ